MTLIGDILSSIGTGLGDFLLSLVKAFVDSFAYLVYVDPAAEVKEYTALIAWVLFGVVLGVGFMIFRAIRGVISRRRA